MNDKQPKYYSIKSLLGSDDYVIPIYQRNYEWGEPQITQLIQDIVDYIVKSKSNNAQTKPRYYIGSLIAYERKLEGSVIYETIDGQQRLTTLTILLNVIKKEYPKIDLSWYKKLNLSFDSRKVASNTLSYLFNGIGLDNKECNVAIQQGYNDTKKSLAKILADNKLSIDEFCNYFSTTIPSNEPSRRHCPRSRRDFGDHLYHSIDAKNYPRRFFFFQLPDKKNVQNFAKL